MKIFTAIKNGIVKPLKWLFAKKRRWIPVVIILSIIALPFLLFAGYIVYKIVDNAINDIQYQRSETTRIEELQFGLHENKEKWLNAGILRYQFAVDIYIGGEKTWEGSHGHSFGGSLKYSLLIDVSENTTVKNKDDSKPVEGHQYCDSISDMYVIIENVLNRETNPDLTAKISKYPSSDLNDNKLLVQALFNAKFGYPEEIVVYRMYGNNEFYFIYFDITYVISDFKIIQ
jgi:hypothetical protein